MKLKDYLKFEDSYKQFEYPEDVRRIVKVMKDRNIEITPDEADELWNMYSDDLCAKWLILPSDDNEIFDTIIHYAKRKYEMEK